MLVLYNSLQYILVQVSTVKFSSFKSTLPKKIVIESGKIGLTHSTEKGGAIFLIRTLRGDIVKGILR